MTKSQALFAGPLNNPVRPRQAAGASIMSHQQTLAALVAYAAKLKNPDARIIQASRLFAAGRSTDSIIRAMDDADDDDTGDALARLKAEKADLMAKYDSLQKQIEALGGEVEYGNSEEAQKLHDDADERSGIAPKTVSAAMAKLKDSGFAAGKPNRGSALRAEALRRWPNLERA